MSTFFADAYYFRGGGGNMNNSLNGCRIAIGSITNAMNAQKILAAAAIPSAVIKYDEQNGGGRGCVYGLSFSCAQSNNVRSVLSGAGVRVRKWNTEN